MARGHYLESHKEQEFHFPPSYLHWSCDPSGLVPSE